jgi:predicted ABC-type ATPase
MAKRTVPLEYAPQLEDPDEPDRMTDTAIDAMVAGIARRFPELVKGKAEDKRHLKFDETQHPRVPAGEHGGGQFTDSGGGGESDVPSLESVIASVGGAREKVAAARAKIDAGTRTDRLVEQGGFKTADGKWTPARQALHERILKNLFTPDIIAAATPAPGEKPVAHLLGGSGGSGKSWFSGPKGTVDRSKAIYLNGDDLKEQLPEYQGWNAALLHEEASELAKRAEALARSHGLNVIVDGTMSSHASLDKRIASFREAGFRVEGHFMRVEPGTAAKRALERFVRGGERGRFVPPELILQSHNLKSFEASRHGLDASEIYDNNGNAPKFVDRR